MKKTLAALAVMGAFAAGSAFAADVTVYGIVDVGLLYQHVDNDDGTDSSDSLTMKSSNQSGSRFGLKGSEDLGNGYSVGFVLENGFDSDTGSLGQASRLFGRESSLHIAGPFGELAFGRVGNLTSGNGSYGIAGNLSPFGTSWSGYAVEGATYFVGYARFDNTVTYKTPTFAGLTGYAQYSFDANSKDADHEEGKSTANRYAALGATYKNGALDLVMTADWYDWSMNMGTSDMDDGYAVTLGGSYDFQVVKAFLGAQYYDNMFKATNGDDDKETLAKIGTGINGQFKGYSVMAGVSVPAFGGTGMFAVGYADTDSAEDDSDAESTRWGLSAGYDYPFSKRTNVYAVAGYYQDSIDNYDNAAGDDRDPTTTAVVIGMRHKF